MLRNILSTRNDYVLAVLRLVLGVVFFAHGAQKMLGWFGGYGFSGTMGYFTMALGLPYILGVLAICAEFFGGISLILGLLGRVGALGILVNMVVAVLMVHRPNGLFMNWNLAVSGGMALGEGYEFHLLALAIALTILVNGSGAFSVEEMLEPAGSRTLRQPV